jgi:hypothetical protein
MITVYSTCRKESYFSFNELPFLLLANKKAVWDIVLENMERQVEKSISF